MSEFAQDQLSRTRLTLKGSWKNVPGGFFVVCLAVGVPLALWSPATRVWPSQKTVSNGEWTHAFEGTVDQQLPLRDMSVGLWATVNYRLFHEGRPGVVVGQDGWLYTAEEFNVPPQAAQEIARKVTYVRAVQQRLQAQSVRLVVAVIPEKARLYSEHLGHHVLPAAHRPMYARFVTQLQQGGILTADVLGAMLHGKPVGAQFLRTDTHWTPLGAQTAAQEIARTLRAEHPTLPIRTFHTYRQQAALYRGDLLRYLPVSAELQPPPDRLQQTRTQVVEDAAGGDLLGTDSIPVALVGTSYSADDRWNFLGALQQALEADVLNVAKPGQGPILPMREYLNSQAFLDTPPQVVIWEIPERYLGMPSPAGGMP